MARSAQRSRFIAAAPDTTYAALRAVAARSFTIEGADDATRTVYFSHSASAWSYGERVSVQVVPAEGGCVLNIAVRNKNPLQIPLRADKLIELIMHDVWAALTASAAMAAPPATGAPQPYVAPAPVLPTREDARGRATMWITLAATLMIVNLIILIATR